MFIHLFSKHTPSQHISLLMNISEGDQLRKRAKQKTIEHVTNVMQNDVKYLHVELAVQKSERQQGEQTKGWSSANVCQYYIIWNIHYAEYMLQNVYWPANIGFDTAESEPRKVCCMVRAREPWFGLDFRAWCTGRTRSRLCPIRPLTRASGDAQHVIIGEYTILKKRRNVRVPLKRTIKK